MRTVGRVLSAVTLIALAATIPVVTAAETPRNDLQIFNDVSRQVQRSSWFTIFDDLNVSVEDGIVRLTGKVTMPYKRTELERRVTAVHGVREVRNQVAVLSVSPFDEELRQRAARIIYGNPAFWNYAAMANPPIHIVVDRGHVTLTGVVGSHVERMLARSLTTGLGAFSVSNALKTDAEMKAALEGI